MNARTDDACAGFLNRHSRGFYVNLERKLCQESAPQVAGPGLVIMGVTKDLVKAGDGKTFPKTGDELTMHYTGWLARTETKFDSSVDKGKPFVFKVREF